MISGICIGRAILGFICSNTFLDLPDEAEKNGAGGLRDSDRRGVVIGSNQCKNRMRQTHLSAFQPRGLFCDHYGSEDGLLHSCILHKSDPLISYSRIRPALFVMVMEDMAQNMIFGCAKLT
jgi:hypothetical protein